MSNTITLNLAGLEAKLDKIIELLERSQPNCQSCVESAVKPAANANAPERATTAQDAPKEEPEQIPIPIEKATHTEAPKPTEDEKPTVTLEQIQQKVLELCTANGGAKKATVRTIINAYGAKVSDLKEQPEKWTEVWGKLTALESEA